MARHARAVGGRDAVLRHRSLHRAGKLDVPAVGISGTITVDRERSGAYRAVRELPGIGRSEQGYADSVGWNLSPTEARATMLVGAELEERRRAAAFDADLLVGRAIAVIEPPRRATWQGKECWKATVMLADGSKTIDYFEIETGRWLGSVDEVTTAAGPLHRETIVMQYGAFDGVWLPVVIKQVLPQYESTTTYVTTTWDMPVDPPIRRPIP